MLVGDNGGAYRHAGRGEANRGLEYMFVMMNEARFVVGMEGSVSERVPTSRRAGLRQGPCPGTEAGGVRRPGR